MNDTGHKDIATGELIDLELIRRFIVVAEELNFTRAAARLGMAQPPLSAAIGKLERKLGVTLLERTSRRVTLTPAGAVLLEQGRIAVEGVVAAVERVRRQGTQARRLTVAVKPGAGTELLKKIMQRCARDPRLPEVHILFGHPGGPAAAVRGGAADVAILRTPFDQRGLDAVTLGNAVAYVPVSVAHQQHSADLAFVPVSDLSPSEVVAAWPDTSRSRAVAGFVRAAAEVAASHASKQPLWPKS